MDKAILLTKLNKCEDESNIVYACYINATSKSFENDIIAFEQHIKDIKVLNAIQYDFTILSEEASKMELTRRDYRELCDAVCMIIGDRINELCKYSKEPIITKPSQFEDYCPFPNEDKVVYGSVNNSFRFFGETYIVVNTKLEETPYYTIWCNEIDRK